MIRFDNKRILIIGASSGIGAETARLLSNIGAEVILIARREDKLQEVCNSITSEKKAYYVGDVSETDSVKGLISNIVSEKGKIDGMVYSAGISDVGTPLKFLTYDRQLKLFNTNYFGFIECVRQVTNRGNYNEGLRIVAVSSVAAMRGEKAVVTYSATKAAMDAAIRCIAKELAPKGICINSVAPSIVKTDIYQNFLDIQGENSQSNENALNRQYLGLAETSDVANSIAFLLSEEARFITGITLPVDGGYSTT